MEETIYQILLKHYKEILEELEEFTDIDTENTELIIDFKNIEIQCRLE